MLATEATVETPEKRSVSTALETWAGNERMRHVPSIDWITTKLDRDVRTRIEKLLPSFSALPFEDPRRAAIEQALRNICRAIDRLADVAKHARTNGAPSDLAQRIMWAIDHAITNLKSVEPNTFGRRYPFHAFERSRSEPLYGSFLAVLHAVDRAIPLVREADPGLDERLLEGLVVLANPVDDRMLKPIA